jgi:hypothetical protein
MPKASKSPAFMFYPSLWLTSTAVELMPPEVEGTYIRLLCRQWIAVTLPVDPSAIRLLTKLTPTQWRKAWPLLEPHFPLTEEGTGRQNATLNGVRSERQAYLNQAAEHGKKGSEKRWGEDRVPYPDPTPDPKGTLPEPYWGKDDSGSGSGSGSSKTQAVVDIPSAPAEVLPWVHPVGHDAAAELFATVPHVATWVGIFRGFASGTSMDNHRPCDPARLAAAVQDFVGAGKHREPGGPSPQLFRGFIKRAKAPVQKHTAQLTEAEYKAEQLRGIREQNERRRRIRQPERPEPAWAPQIDAMFPDGRTHPLAGVA